MTASLIDGTAAVKAVYAGLKSRVATLAKAGIRPGLAAVQVGDDPASKIYIRNKVRACDEVGVHSEVHKFAADCQEAALLDAIRALNRNPAIHGILLQLPLPRHLDADRIAQAVDPRKDVDGLTWASLGALMASHPGFEACTPAGVIVLLERAGIPIDGRDAVVVGRSTEVGKPMALMLMARGATVTICHSRTRDLAQHTRRADILVAAIGKPRFITRDMVKAGAAVIDVGINRLPDGKLAGDVDTTAVSEIAGAITPVPGGVGPMTVAMLVANTVHAAEQRPLSN
ncbi:MAG TPA: bifunctional methylenetetrahydrofolate dehydrogenase/methenyltetrahydrofolate cyclohydrolase FolD [Burkholderiales bacterium]|nr:bifunctional methylenetetrahydrofolate dehydrogenase/methenyltetrahydrofolate cyclohydrolase FolD [Burkholderiales bacterium]